MFFARKFPCTQAVFTITSNWISWRERLASIEPCNSLLVIYGLLCISNAHSHQALILLNAHDDTHRTEIEKFPKTISLRLISTAFVATQINTTQFFVVVVGIPLLVRLKLFDFTTTRLVWLRDNINIHVNNVQCFHNNINFRECVIRWYGYF